MHVCVSNRKSFRNQICTHYRTVVKRATMKALMLQHLNIYKFSILEVFTDWRKKL